jgi:hypothetical protein
MFCLAELKICAKSDCKPFLDLVSVHTTSVHAMSAHAMSAHTMSAHATSVHATSAHAMSVHAIMHNHAHPLTHHGVCMLLSPPYPSWSVHATITPLPTPITPTSNSVPRDGRQQ